MTSALFRAVESLMDPTTIRVWREDRRVTEHHHVPSLWDQLCGSSAWGTGEGGTSRFGSRPVISTAVVALTIEIRGAITEACTDFARIITNTKGQRDTRLELHAIAANIPDPDQEVAWTELTRSWVTRAKQTLGLNPPRPQWARGTPCPACQATTAHTTQDGEQIRTPALAITWVGPDDDREYHSDGEWMVRAVTCRACEESWWRGEGLAWLTDQVMNTQPSLT